MNASFLLVQSHADHGPDLLEDLLRSRAREFLLVRRDQGEALPASSAVRALVVLGGAEPDADVRALATSCAADGLPVLAVGLGAGALLDAVDAVAPAVEGFSPTDAVKGDELCEGLEPDTGLVRSAHFPAVPPDAVVLAVGEDGAPAVLRLGERGYALAFSPEHDAAWLLGVTEADDDTREALTRRNRFLRPHTIALLGRWVDGVVGRTEDEAPWGRSGPPPESRPGLYLNPAAS